jgi:thioester reductase-like protein
LEEVQFTFCSSTASVLGASGTSDIKERISTNPIDADVIGYSRSKWVAEAICASAAKKLPGTIKILRLGQLTGDTENGVWNMSEAWPLMLTTAYTLNCLPMLEEPLGWLPFDTAATAVVEIALQNAQSDKQPEVYHLVNHSADATWSNLLSWSRDVGPQPYDIVAPKVWLDMLERFPKPIPAKNFLHLWRNAYGNGSHREDPQTRHGKMRFSIREAQKSSVMMRNIPPVDQALVKKIWLWLDEEIRKTTIQD